ncbi:MAG: ComEC/Rec2 family competence protein [Elainella sp.]
MIAIIVAIVCLAYIGGLLLTGLPELVPLPETVAGLPVGGLALLLGGVAAASLIRRVWRAAPKPWVWLVAGLIGLLASLYCELRQPQPTPDDICHLIKPDRPSAVCTVEAKAAVQAKAEISLIQVRGEVKTPPRLTRSQQLQFELDAAQVTGLDRTKTVSLPEQPIAGRLYVTLPPTLGEQLYPGLSVTLSGRPSRPKPAANPGEFDFQRYLAQQGIFTILRARAVEYPSGPKPAPPLFWQIRQRIVQVQAMGLGQPEAALVSAMVMGKRAVDLPFSVQDQFKQTGLAHALAASGAQVTLLLGVVLALTQRFSAPIRFGLGSGILVLYIGLTGLEPSVLRAGLMGFATLVALVADRKVKPLNSLLVAAVLLLLYQPGWIFDLGFQLSFLATLGLLVTVPILSKWLDWLPSAITPLFAVPIAAYLWTMPLLLFTFGNVSPYSIPINVLASPLIGAISLGGMASAAAALLYPPLGSLLAWLLSYPAHLFLKLAEIGGQLPGTAIAVGTISALQVLLLYGLIVLIWRWQKVHRYWGLALVFGLALVAIPSYSASDSQVTVLATSGSPMLVVQDQGKTGLIYGGDSNQVRFTLLPFLQKQGINQLSWAVAPSLDADELEGWQQVVAVKPPRLFYSSPDRSLSSDAIQTYRALSQQVKTQQGTALPLTLGQQLRFGRTTVTAIHSKPDLLLLQAQGQTWLWFSGVPAAKQTDWLQKLPVLDGIGWSGKALPPAWLNRLNPRQAIVFGDLDAQTAQWFTQKQIPVHALPETAVRWNEQGLTSLLEEPT